MNNNTDSFHLLEKIERSIGYTFKDKQLGLSAITTRAYSNEHPGCPDNQSLEFLGDAVLSLVSAELLYEKCSQLQDNEKLTDLTPEGVMTKIRQEVVNNQYLAEYAERYDLYDYIYDSGENPNGTAIGSVSCGADIIEALIAAVYLDNNKSISRAKSFILEFLELSLLIDNEEKLMEAITRKNPKDMLIHKLQKLKRYTPVIEYPLSEDRFNKNENIHHFVLGISIDGKLLPGITGEGQNKGTAEYEAAKKAYSLLESLDWDLAHI